jgi:hypothetical protein
MRTRRLYHLDDLSFKNLLVNSEVIGLKEHSKWNWDYIHEIISGCMLNPKRLDELQKCRFIARLIHFFRPFSHLYADISAKDVFLKIYSALCKQDNRDWLFTLLFLNYYDRRNSCYIRIEMGIRDIRLSCAAC